jgi:flagellar hook-basal body complex protein FliE
MIDSGALQMITRFPELTPTVALDVTKAQGNVGLQNPGQVLGNFGDFLTEQMQHVSQLQQSSEQTIKAYASGADIPLHQVMIGMEQSGAAMDLMMQLRNKLVGAYQELSRMQF